jgi:hypothetical protein
MQKKNSEKSKHRLDRRSSVTAVRPAVYGPTLGRRLCCRRTFIGRRLCYADGVDNYADGFSTPTVFFVEFLFNELRRRPRQKTIDIALGHRRSVLFP